MKKNLFSILLKIDILIIEILYKLRYIFDFKTNILLKPVLKKNIELFRHKKNEVCAILGLGPSLKSFTFEDEKIDTIAVNRFNLFQKKEVPNYFPNFWILFDNYFFSNSYKDILSDLIKDNPHSFFILNGKYYSKNFDQKNVFYSIGRGGFPKKNIDFCKNIPSPFNVVLAAIELAIYLGYKEIRLYGCEFNQFCRPKDFYCYKQEVINHTPLTDNLFTCSFTAYAHSRIAAIAKKNDIKIINYTPNSTLDSYESID